MNWRRFRKVMIGLCCGGSLLASACNPLGSSMMQQLLMMALSGAVGT